MMDKLKECPFCGSTVKIDEEDFYMFCCDKCGAGVTFAKVFEDGTAGDCSKEESITAWNRRATPENKALTVEQLRQMDGEPVYCIGLKNRALDGWGLIDVDGDAIYDGTNDYWDLGECGIRYNAYARRPEQEAAP
jgi:Lar family restriction alleviation protein